MAQSAKDDKREDPPAKAKSEPPKPKSPDEGRPSLKPDEAKNLLRAGHRLKKRGDPDEAWFTFQHAGAGQYLLARPLTAEEEEDLLDEDLVLIV